LSDEKPRLFFTSFLHKLKKISQLGGHLRVCTLAEQHWFNGKLREELECYLVIWAAFDGIFTRFPLEELGDFIDVLSG